MGTLPMHGAAGLRAHTSISERTSLRYAHVELGKKVMYTGYDPVLPINRLLSHLRHTHNLLLNGVT